MKSVEERLGPYTVREMMDQPLHEPGQEYKDFRKLDPTNMTPDTKELKDRGTKFDAGKLRYDLIPPEALKELAKVYTHGAGVYGDNNWQKGLGRGRMMASLMRHLEKYRMGGVNDPAGFAHMAAVAFYAFAFLWYDSRKETEHAVPPQKWKVDLF